MERKPSLEPTSFIYLLLVEGSMHHKLNLAAAFRNMSIGEYIKQAARFRNENVPARKEDFIYDIYDEQGGRLTPEETEKLIKTSPQGTGWPTLEPIECDAKEEMDLFALEADLRG